MALSTGPTSKLCEWVCSTRYEDLPAEVLKEMKTMLYDQVGCMIAVATLPSCQPVVDLIRKLGGHEECSIVGHPVRTSLMNAALANGAIGHGGELDSTSQQAMGHVAAHTVPAALTVGQYVGASGKEFMRALALGSEVAARFQSVFDAYQGRGKFVQQVGGAMGDTISAGLLLGLDAKQLGHALGLAASGACGLHDHHTETLHQNKSLNFGRVVSAGVLSALLAQQGVQGPQDILTIKKGFCDTFMGVPEAGYEVVEGLGEHYLIRQILYKRYPVGRPAQGPIYAFLQLMRKHDLTSDDITEIEARVWSSSVGRLTAYKHPCFHLETILSLAAIYGEITLAHIHDPQYQEDPRFKAFRDRVCISIIPRSGQGHIGQRLEMTITTITVHTRAGKELSEELPYPVMGEEEIQQKFRALVGLRLDGQKVADLEMRLKAVETMESMAPLARQLEVPY